MNNRFSISVNSGVVSGNNGGGRSSVFVGVRHGEHRREIKVLKSFS